MANENSAAGAIDLATFKELQATTGADFVVELVDAFLADAPVLLKALQAALAASDPAAFRRAAHSLKSNGNTFGAFGFSALARELEETPLPALGSRAGMLLAALEASYVQADTQLRSLCHG
jgi:HPt (histidine-containing phosphotransfer) domain-containing protein